VSEQVALIFTLGLYKLACLTTGLALSFMGYRLFVSGIWGESGDLNATFGNNKIVLKKAAPGTFFAIAGAIVIGLAIFKGIRFDFTPQDILESKPPLP